MDNSVNSSKEKSEDIKLKIWPAKQYLKKFLKQWCSWACIISSQSRSGKSYLARHLLMDVVPKFDFVIVCASTVQNGFYDFLDTKLMFEYVPDRVINELKKTYYESEKKFKSLVIVDDMLSNSLKYEETITSLFTSGRHWQCSVIVLGQKMSLLSTTWSCNATLFIFLYSQLREKIYISQNILAGVINARARDVNLREEEKKAVNLLTDTCVDFQGLVVCPLTNEIYKYKAP